MKARRRLEAADEAQLSLERPVLNWQARFSWWCACWGLIPLVGLPLGLLGAVFGILGYLRVRLRPDDLGIRDSVGGVLLGGLELIVNLVGIYCLWRGWHQLHSPAA